MAADLGYEELAFTKSRTIRSLDSSAFVLQRAERASQRPPFVKSTPSKWDDAHKWIASPTSEKQGRGRGGGGGGGCKKRTGSNRQGGGTLMVDREVVQEVDTRRGELEEQKMRSSVDWVPADACAKPAFFVDISVSKSAMHLSQHDPSSMTIQGATSFGSPPSTGKSVSLRDTGTEMTPIASQEPSRNGTPVRASTPLPTSTMSLPSPPQRSFPSPTPSESTDFFGELGRKELSARELQLKTRREIMALGTKLGKLNVAAWASKRQEGKEASSLLVKRGPSDPPPKKSVADVRAAAWEEAEKAKYMARFKREEKKIQVWENHLKAKAEAEMRKTEVEVERVRARAQDRLMSKLTSARHKAEEKHAAAEAQCNRQAEKTSQKAESIRRTGKIPSSFYCWSWCS